MVGRRRSVSLFVQGYRRKGTVNLWNRYRSERLYSAKHKETASRKRKEERREKERAEEAGYTGCVACHVDVAHLSNGKWTIFQADKSCE